MKLLFCLLLITPTAWGGWVEERVEKKQLLDTARRMVTWTKRLHTQAQYPSQMDGFHPASVEFRKNYWMAYLHSVRELRATMQDVQNKLGKNSRTLNLFASYLDACETLERDLSDAESTGKGLSEAMSEMGITISSLAL